MRTFVTGKWGRPNGLEQHVYRHDANARFQRWPNQDLMHFGGPQRGETRSPDADPFEGVEDPLQYDWAEYYRLMDKQILDFAPDLIVGCFIDDALTGSMKERWGSQIPTLVVPKEAAQLENDRWYARQVTQRCGVRASAMRKFQTRDEAMEFVANDRYWTGYVIKTPDAGSPLPGVVAEVCRSRQEALSTLESRPDTWYPVVIEEFLEGVEIAFSVLVDYSTDTLVPMVTDFEYTKFATGDLGCETSEMGAHDISGLGARPMREIFEPLLPWLREVKYQGWLDASCMYDAKRDTLTVFEFMTRLGSSEFELAMTLMGSDFREVALKLLGGKLRPDDVSWRANHAIGVTVADMFFITGAGQRHSIITGPVSELLCGRATTDGAYEALSRMQCVLDDKRMLRTNGDRVFLAVGAADTYKQARHHAYNVARICRFPGHVYRTDIGYRWEDEEMRGAMADAGILPKGWWRG